MKYVLILLTVLSLFGCQPAKGARCRWCFRYGKLVVIDSKLAR